MSASAPPDPASSTAHQKARADERTNDESSSALRELGSLVPAIVGIGGALAYGMLIVSYSEFYAELGVAPSEVGLELGPGLGGIAGISVLLILALILLSVYALAIPWMAPVSDFEARKGARPLLVRPLIVFGVIAVVVIGWSLHNSARDAAKKARAGTPVRPLTFLGVELVALRADRAEVRPADPKAGETAAYRALRNLTRSMYLGRSGNTLVIYDPDLQSSWRIPASMFTVRTLNCEKHVEPRPRDCPG